MTRRFTFVFLLLCGLAMLQTPAMFSQSGFANADFRGNFTFSFDGTIINKADNTALPVSALGLMTFDGQGKVTQATRYLNFAGQVIKQTASGTYNVTPEGLGTAAFTVVAATGEPNIVPPTLETFYFVVNNRQSISALSASIRAANGQDIGLLAVTRISIVRQNDACWNDC